MCEACGVSDVGLTRLHLDVYATREGSWNPEHCELEIPGDWDFLAQGSKPTSASSGVVATVAFPNLDWRASTFSVRPCVEAPMLPKACSGAKRMTN